MGDVVSTIFGSDPGSPPNVQVWQPSGTSTADTTWQNLTNYAAGNNPYRANQQYYNQYLQSSLNNPYAAGMQTSANNAGTAYTNTGNTAIANSGILSDAAINLLGAGQSVWNTASDPQSALYNRTLQQLQDQIRVGQAARGITPSAYGDNLENQALSNFNIDWQNNQLNRQVTGLNALQGATGQAGTSMGDANSLGSSGAKEIAYGGSVPYSAYTSQLGDILTALSNYGQQTGDASNSLGLNTANSLLNYMNLGAGQSNQQGNFDISNWENQMAYDNYHNQQIAGIADSILGGLSSGASYSGYPSTAKFLSSLAAL